MKNKLLIEELNRFKKIISYDPKNPMINEDTDVSISKEIVDRLKPDLPLNDTSDKLESILLLQKTLVALGKLKKTYGIDGDGVDGDFGTDTKSSLRNTIGDASLTEDNINNFETVLENNESKISNVISNYEVFIEKFKSQAGVSLEYLQTCTKETDYKELKFIPKVKKCHLIEDIANVLNEIFPDDSPVIKSAILSVMRKEQGKGSYICAPNNNYAGVQTDSGDWGNKADYFNDQFCAKDKEKVRSFASFNSLDDGLQFIKKAFDDKEWFISLLKDIDDESVEIEESELEKISKKHADIWQTKWNLSLNGEDFERFKKYGYNPNLIGKSFSDSRGIYNKSVSDFTPEELEIHNGNNGNYRTPESIKKGLNSVSKFFTDAFNLFKEIDNEKTEDINI